MSLRIWYNTNREWENYIQEFRIDRGMSLKELGERSNVPEQQVHALANGMISPIYQINQPSKGLRRGQIKPWVLRICITLNAQPEVMFPREICPLEDPKIKGFHKTQIAEMSLSSYGQCGISDVLNSTYLRRFIWRYITRRFWKKPLNNYHPRKYKRIVKVLHMRFLCDMSLDTVSVKLNMGRERVRQIEAQGLRYMRNRLHVRELREHIEHPIVDTY